MAARLGVRVGIGKMLAALLEGPCCLQELIDRSGLARSTVHTWMRDFRKLGLVRICAWEALPTGQQTRPVYELNTEHKKDAPRPRKKPGSVRQKRYRARKNLGPWAQLAMP